MRNNQPVTQREFELPEGATLMSTTDPESHLLYANEAFVHVSGFTREELQGQPHNIVRHPDMPREAFADMWATLQQGLPWTALVKNRRKDGDHYWVRANAVPVVRDGVTVSFMSVRTKPSREEIAGAEALYRDMREGRAGGRRFHHGVMLRSGVAGAFNLRKTLTVRGRIRATMFMMWLMVLLIAAPLAATMAALGKVAAVVALGAAITSFILERQFAEPMEALLRQALNVATGANRDPVQLDRVDEIGMTMRTINQLGLMFKWLVDDVSEQVGAVKDSATEIAAGNDDLSSRTEQSAASVEETASSMEQMAVTLKNNAQMAQQANSLARAATDAATAGGEAVGHVVRTMDEISGSSRRIADIISVIDGIAFQTNILALNAAVEAARAGEQGRGFAVVAGEVRALAQRSAGAAKEIKTLISESVEKVETGTKLVANAGQTMEAIVNQVKRVGSLIREMSSANTEQSAGITQVSQAVSHLDQITQQNAALVEQSSAASQSLRSQADRLSDAIGVFR